MRQLSGIIMSKETGPVDSDMNVISDKFKNRKGAKKNRNGEESSHEEERQKKKKMIEEVKYPSSLENNIRFPLISAFLPHS